MYEPKTFANLEHLTTLSAPQLALHLKLYGGYVRASNTIAERIQQLPDAACEPGYSELAELHRRYAFAFNGMVLHELYFEALGADDGASSELDAATAAFGGRKKVIASLVNVALCGVGWSLLLRDRVTGALRVAFIGEHHIGLPVGQDVILALDAWEHAYGVDYGADRARYAHALMGEVNWRVAAERFARSVHGQHVAHGAAAGHAHGTAATYAPWGTSSAAHRDRADGASQPHAPFQDR